MITPAPLTLFLIVIFGVCCAFVVLLMRAFPGRSTRVVIGVGVWLAISGALPFVLHASGVSTAWQFPMFATTLVATVVVAVGKFGDRVVAANGLALLAAVHVFRLPLEYVLTIWHDHNFIPVQMTWHGDNLDVVTGILALPAAALVARNRWPHLTAAVFNILGLALLGKIIWIVALSSPTPLRSLIGGYASGPDVLVGFFFPSIWIASIAVAGAVFLHVAALAFLVRRRRLETRQSRIPAAPSPSGRTTPGPSA